MNKRFVEWVARKAIRARVRTSPRIWKWFYRSRRASTDQLNDAMAVYMEFIHSPMDEAERIIRNFAYKWDYFLGAIDASIPANMAYQFFIPRRRGRDCDDFARLWSVWGVHNGYEAQEWIHITYRKPIKLAHVVTTLTKDGQYWLCDRLTFGPYATMDEALALCGDRRGDGVFIEYMWKDEKKVCV